MSAAQNPACAGLFATARKGGLSNEEIRQIEAHRAKDRPTPWSALAKRYGRCEADIRAYFITDCLEAPSGGPATVEVTSEIVAEVSFDELCAGFTASMKRGIHNAAELSPVATAQPHPLRPVEGIL